MFCLVYISSYCSDLLRMTSNVVNCDKNAINVCFKEQLIRIILSKWYFMRYCTSQI